MLRQGPSRAPYRCKRCSEHTGQVVYRNGHKCPFRVVQTSDAPLDILPGVPLDVPLDQPFDLSGISPMEGGSGLLGGGQDMFGLAELSLLIPAHGGVDFGVRIHLPHLQYLTVSQICIALVVCQLRMKLDSSPVRMIC